MQKQLVCAKIISKKEIAKNIFEFIIDADNELNTAVAGQFIHIKCGDKVYLRRPISICQVKNKKLRFIFEVRGKGTKELAQHQVGDVLDIMGPLGKGFSAYKEYKNPVVIGGGIGIYPLLQVSDLIHPTAILGFRTKELVTLEEDFKQSCKEVFITTDDGTYGKKGFVTDVLIDLVNKSEVDAIFACGPMGMLKAIKNIAITNNIFLEVSLEERMGCGIGACLCCATKVKDEDLEEFTYAHVCKNGPVFNADEVIF